MNIKINGKSETIQANSIAELIIQKGLCAERIVVEHNFNILSKEKWTEVILSENDNIEIVSFVAGG